jgi:hypothetical protein
VAFFVLPAKEPWEPYEVLALPKCNISVLPFHLYLVSHLVSSRSSTVEVLDTSVASQCAITDCNLEIPNLVLIWRILV